MNLQHVNSEAVYSVRRSLITDHRSFTRMNPASGLLHAGRSLVVQRLNMGSPSSLVLGFLVFLYCISPSVLLLPTFPALCLHPFVALLLLPRFSAVRIQCMIVPLPLKDKIKLHLLIGGASTDSHPSYSFHLNVLPWEQCIIYIRAFRPAWASFNRFSKRTVRGSKIIKTYGVISVWGILAMPSCGCKKETFKIVVRRNSPHTLRTPFITTRTHVARNALYFSGNTKGRRIETLLTSTDSHSPLPRPQRLFAASP